MRTSPENLRAVRDKQLLEDAQRITEEIGHVTTRITAGQGVSAELYVQDIAAAAARMLQCIAALETLDALEKNRG